MQININREDLVIWQKHIYGITLGAAQRVHEYNEQLGYIVEDAGWNASTHHLIGADKAWLSIGLKQSNVEYDQGKWKE